MRLPIQIVLFSFKHENYPKQREETLITTLTIVNNSVNFLQGTISFGYELHCLLRPTMHSSLQKKSKRSMVNIQKIINQEHNHIS